MSPPFTRRAGICAMVASTCSEVRLRRPPRRPAEAHGRAGLVEQVDRLVGQPPVAQVAVREQGGVVDRLLAVGHAVVLLVAVLRPSRICVVSSAEGSRHLDFLEAARERRVALEGLAVLLPGGGADAAQGAVLEGRLEQVRGVHGAAAGAAGADHGVDLVDEQDRVLLLGQGATAPP